MDDENDTVTDAVHGIASHHNRTDLINYFIERRCTCDTRFKRTIISPLNFDHATLENAIQRTHNY